MLTPRNFVLLLCLLLVPQVALAGDRTQQVKPRASLKVVRLTGNTARIKVSRVTLKHGAKVTGVHKPLRTPRIKTHKVRIKVLRIRMGSLSSLGALLTGKKPTKVKMKRAVARRYRSRRDRSLANTARRLGAHRVVVQITVRSNLRDLAALLDPVSLNQRAQDLQDMRAE